MRLRQVEQKVVIVTGAGSGIGKACAVRYAEAGYAVLVADLNGSAAEHTCDDIAATGSTAVACELDVSNPESSDILRETALKQYGRIDVLVANAGVQIGGSLVESTETDWDTILGVNLKGAAYCCKAVLPEMADRGYGAIVMISSINALRGSAGMAIYDISKAGVLALARNLAVEYGAKAVRVNAICPGNTITNFHIDKMAEQGITVDQIRDMSKGYGLLGRAAEPAEIANAAYFLGSDEASFITGQTICVDGGFSVTGGG